jgi:hypothetical protein
MVVVNAAAMETSGQHNGYRNPSPGNQKHAGTKGSMEKGVVRVVRLSMITGVADDDPSAVGTYASAGASFGPSSLSMAPVTFPMMFAVVYLSAKLAQVADEGLFAIL